MRRRSVLVALLACGCGRLWFESSDPDARTTDSTDSLPADSPIASAVAIWTFDEGTGTIANDASGRGHSMTLNNGVGWTTGVSNAAVTADGIDDYGIVDTLDLSGTASVTISILVNRTYTNGPNHTLVELTNDTNLATTGLGIFPDNTTNCTGQGRILLFVVGDNAYSGNCYAQPTSGVWHHLVAVFDKTRSGTQETQLYIDGVAQATTSAPWNKDNTNMFGAHPLYVFARNGVPETMSASIDELIVWDRALTPAEIVALPGP